MLFSAHPIPIIFQQCEIGDASRGTLSSYAHTMMLIHYLQQRNPPVVPVIQELGFAGKSKPQRLVDGWNTWFITDLNALVSYDFHML